MDNYLAFFCSNCKLWYCGLCYSVTNKNRDLDECCPGKCGPVKSTDQITVREWFPQKEARITLSIKDSLSKPVTATMSEPEIPTIASLASSVTAPTIGVSSDAVHVVGPTGSLSTVVNGTSLPKFTTLPSNDLQDLWSNYLHELNQMFQTVRNENSELKRKLSEVEDYRTRYETIKKKLNKFIDNEL